MAKHDGLESDMIECLNTAREPVKGMTIDSKLIIPYRTMEGALTSIWRTLPLIASLSLSVILWLVTPFSTQLRLMAFLR